MSEHGETPASSITRPSQDSGGVQEETYGLQNEVVSKCVEVVQQFRAGKFSKPKASILLFQAIPQGQLEESAFVTAYGAYMGMLDNFEHYRDSAAQSGRQRVSALIDLDHATGGAPEQEAPVVSSAKRARSPGSDSDDGGEYKKRTCLDYEALPWNEPDDPEAQRSTELSPSLQKTQSLLENFSKDVKRARANLLNCGRSYPQFPQSEWLNLLAGNSVDLDHIFSNIYSITQEDRESVSIGKNLELLHGSSVPAKTVKTHGDWVIAWEALVDATQFVFKHRRLELQLYGRHIQRYFASIPPQFHSRVINYDRAVRIRVAQRRDLELTDFAEFSDLRIQWINVPSTTTAASVRSSDFRLQQASGRRFRDACRRWNDRKCPNTAASCNYAHVCISCRSSAHVGKDCTTVSKK